MSRGKRTEQLKHIAAVNIKKEGGRKRAVGDELAEAVHNYPDLILKQIELYEPDIIVCGGLSARGIKSTAALLKDSVFAKSGDWKELKSDIFARSWWHYDVILNHRKIPIVEFCHPQVTCLEGKRGHELFEALYNDMRYIRKELIDK